MLYDNNIIEAIEERDIWRFRGELVTNGMFAVGMPKKRLIVRSDGSKGVQQRLIVNLIPINSLHDDVELGEYDLIPTEARFNSLFLLPLQYLLMSARDRKVIEGPIRALNLGPLTIVTIDEVFR